MKTKNFLFSVFVSMMMLFIMNACVFADGEVAEISGTQYPTLEEAIAHVQTGETIKLISNVDLGENAGIVIDGGKTFTLDLNGKNISAGNSTLTIQNTNVTITGKGTIKEKDPYYGAIVLKGSSESVADYTKVVIEKDVKLSGYAPIFIGNNTINTPYGIVADVYGTLESQKDTAGTEGSGIYVNGLLKDKQNCPIINIYSPAKISADEGEGIYAAGYAKWNITGGMITGKTAIYQKSGSITISGNPTIEATGAKVDYKHDGNGCDATGDAIVVESCNYSGNTPEIAINGGYFISANNKSIGSYATDECTPVTGFVSGGYFNDYDSTLVASDKAYVSSDKDEYLYRVVDKYKLLGDAKTSAIYSLKLSSDDGNVKELFENLFKCNEDTLNQIAFDTLNDPSIVPTKVGVESSIQNYNGTQSGKIEYNPDEGDKVEIEIEITMNVDVKTFTEENVIVEITPKYSFNAYVIKSDGTRSKKGVTIILQETLKITKPLEMWLPLPENFASVGDTVYIAHKDYVYEAKVESGAQAGSLVAHFTNPDGFSEFTITKDNSAVASIYDSKTKNTTYYTTLNQAIKEIKNNERISILQNCEETITINKVISFEVSVADGVEFTGEIKADTSLNLSVTEENGIKTYKFTTKEDKPEDKPSTSTSSTRKTTYTIKFDTNGGNKIKNERVKLNKKVTRPEDPTKDGYTFAGWFKNEELTREYNFDSKVTKSFTLYAKWEEVEEEYQNPFTDVKSSEWFYDAIKFANQNKIFNGITKTTFEPNTAMTRGMFVTVLYRMAGEPEVTGESKFIDVVKGSYYEKAVIWAEENGIVNGISDTEFAPNSKITREQMSAIMLRFAEYKEYDVSVGEDTNILSYEDFEQVSEYAIPSMQWAVGTGLMKGKTDSTLNPTQVTTRAEVATLLQRFVQNN